MKKLTTPFVILMLFMAVACGPGSDASKTSPYAGNEEGLKKLAIELDASEDLSIIKTLKPTLEDCKAIAANEEDAQKLFEATEEMYKEVEKMGKNPIHRKEGQDDVLIRKGSKKEGMKEISGGYEMNQDSWHDDLTIWEIKYIVSGETLGMKYSGFFFVNDHWVFIPKPYRIF